MQARRHTGIYLLLLLCFVSGCMRSVSPAPGDHPPIGQASPLEEPTRSREPENHLPAQQPEKPAGCASCPQAEDQLQAFTGYNQKRAVQVVLDEALEFCEVASDYWSKGDFENALLALDKAYGLILEAQVNDDPELIQQKEDIRYLISKRILQIHASRHTVVAGKHQAIPLENNVEVEMQIKMYQTSHRNFFLKAYQRSGRYREKILKAVEETGLPKELSWLPLIESGFKVKALSRARALGLWQFIPSTGYRFGLKRDEWIDERMHTDKSTQAAIAYLQELHGVFGDWCTVLAAYNCGENRVLRIIRNQKVNYLDHFWDLYARLPIETRQYVPRFLAILSIIQDPEKYGFELKELDRPLEYETVTLSKQLRLADIAKAIDADADLLEMLNPELRRRITPPTLYTLKIPPGQLELAAEKIESLSAYKPPPRRYACHRIRSGETLSHLAEKYHTTIQRIAKANRIRVTSLLQLGQRIRIPLRSKTPSLSRGNTRRPKKKPAVTTVPHKIQSGDSLWLLAQRYNTTVEEIKRLNNLTDDQLQMDQQLVIDKNQSTGKPVSGTKSYLVKQGDSPYSIAIQHQMELERFLHLNQLTPKSTIFPGQVVRVDDD